MPLAKTLSIIYSLRLWEQNSFAVLVPGWNLRYRRFHFWRPPFLSAETLATFERPDSSASSASQSAPPPPGRPRTPETRNTNHCFSAPKQPVRLGDLSSFGRLFKSLRLHFWATIGRTVGQLELFSKLIMFWLGEKITWFCASQLG